MSVGVLGRVEKASSRWKETEVLVLMDRSLLPEGWNRDCPGWEELATIFARLRVLEVCRSSRVGRLQPITFSAVRMICCSLLLSLAAVYQMVMEEVGMDSMIVGLCSF